MGSVRLAPVPSGRRRPAARPGIIGWLALLAAAAARAGDREAPKDFVPLFNGRVVIPGTRLPEMAPRGRIGLQHHGQMRDGRWVGPPSLVQFKNVFIKELND